MACLIQKCCKKKVKAAPPPPKPGPPPEWDGYLRHLDHLSQIRRLRSIEVSPNNAFKVDFWEDDIDYDFNDDHYYGMMYHPHPASTYGYRQVGPSQRYGMAMSLPPPSSYYGAPGPMSHYGALPMQSYNGPPPMRPYGHTPPPSYDYYGRAPPTWDYYGYGGY